MEYKKQIKILSVTDLRGGRRGTRVASCRGQQQQGLHQASAPPSITPPLLLSWTLQGYPRTGQDRRGKRERGLRKEAAAWESLVLPLPATLPHPAFCCQVRFSLLCPFLTLCFPIRFGPDWRDLGKPQRGQKEETLPATPSLLLSGTSATSALSPSGLGPKYFTATLRLLVKSGV